MKAGKLIWLAIICLQLGSCAQKQFETKEEMVAFLGDEQNGFVQNKTVNGVDFSVMYKPTDMLVSQEVNDNASEAEIEALRDKYGKNLYFNISISKNKQELLSNVAEGRQKFGAMVNQLAFGMTEKVHLFSPGKDTVELLDYVYPRMFGMSRATTMLFVYPRDPKITMQDQLSITVEDLGINTGDITFKITKDIFEKEPQLIF